MARRPSGRSPWRRLSSVKCERAPPMSCRVGEHAARGIRQRVEQRRLRHVAGRGEHPEPHDGLHGLGGRIDRVADRGGIIGGDPHVERQLPRLASCAVERARQEAARVSSSTRSRGDAVGQRMRATTRRRARWTRRASPRARAVQSPTSSTTVDACAGAPSRHPSVARSREVRPGRPGRPPTAR